MYRCEWTGTMEGAQATKTEWMFHPCDNFEPMISDEKEIYCNSCKMDIRKPKLTHEDLAIKYCNKTIKSPHYYPEINVMELMRDQIKKAFIAGRESADVL